MGNTGKMLLGHANQSNLTIYAPAFRSLRAFEALVKPRDGKELLAGCTGRLHRSQLHRRSPHGKERGRGDQGAHSGRGPTPG